MPQSKKDQSWLKKAYDNDEFLNSPAARNIRILCEMTEPAHRIRTKRIYNTIVFFGSARSVPLSESRKALKKLKARKTKGKKYQQELALAELNIKFSRYYDDARRLSAKLTQWFNQPKHRNENFYICSGGGPGMMEAANRGAKEAGGKSVGLNISLPMEQQFPNIYQTKDISFDFHYFFIRKFWFFYLAKSLVVFPGGYGTFDELFELLTIIQTHKTKKHMPVILYGSEYWNEVINFDAMVKWGTISKEDLKLFHTFDDVDETFTFLKKEITKHYFRR